MENSKLIQVLNTFSKEEWKEFGKFASSGYFNKGRDYSSLIKELKRFYPDFDSPKLTSEYLYLKLYPGKKHNRNVIKTIFTGLYRLAEEFLIQKDFESKTFNRNLSLLHQLSSRNINGIHDRIFDGIEQRLKTQEATEEMFESLHRLQTHKVQHSYKSNFEKTIGVNIPLRGDYHFLSYIIPMLAYIRDLQVLKDDYNIETAENFSRLMFNELNIEKFLSYARKFYPHFNPVIETIVKCYIAGVTTDDVYLEAKDLLFKNLHRFEKKYLREITLVMEGGAIIRINSGNRKFIGELRELHSFSLDNGLHTYEDSKHMHPLAADIYIFTAFWNKEHKWIESFLSEHRHELPDEFRNYLYSIGNAYVCFSRKEYRKALKILSTIDSKLFPFKRKIYSLQLQIYYELNEYDLALSGLDNYKHFITSNEKYIEKSKNSSLLFTSFYEQILKHRFDSAETNFKGIRKIISGNVPTQGSDWILEKIDEIEKQ